MLELSDNGFFCGSVFVGVCVGVALASELAVRACRRGDGGDEVIVDAVDERRDELTVDIGVSQAQRRFAEHRKSCGASECQSLVVNEVLAQVGRERPEAEPRGGWAD